MHGSGTAVASDTTNNSIYVCDANGYTSTTHGSISEVGRLDSNFAVSDFSEVDLSD